MPSVSDYLSSGKPKEKLPLMPDFSNTGDIALQNQKTLRKLVGTLGILLPLLVYLFLQITNNFDSVLPSISHYYFTRAASFFEIIISLLAVFLLIYKGEGPLDYILSTLAGISALLLLIFPTCNLKDYRDSTTYNSVAVTWFAQSDFRPMFHFVSAAIFLISLASMSLFLFTRSSNSKTAKKKLRNIVYIVCGSIMLTALVVAFLGHINVINDNFYESHHLTFWAETIAVEAFGISWMVKGEAVLAD